MADGGASFLPTSATDSSLLGSSVPWAWRCTRGSHLVGRLASFVCTVAAAPLRLRWITDRLTAFSDSDSDVRCARPILSILSRRSVILPPLQQLIDCGVAGGTLEVKQVIRDGRLRARRRAYGRRTRCHRGWRRHTLSLGGGNFTQHTPTYLTVKLTVYSLTIVAVIGKDNMIA